MKKKSRLFPFLTKVAQHERTKAITGSHVSNYFFRTILLSYLKLYQLANVLPLVECSRHHGRFKPLYRHDSLSLIQKCKFLNELISQDHSVRLWSEKTILRDWLVNCLIPAVLFLFMDMLS